MQGIASALGEIEIMPEVVAGVALSGISGGGQPNQIEANPAMAPAFLKTLS
jgi:hypothetical protein